MYDAERNSDLARVQEKWRDPTEAEMLAQALVMAIHGAKGFIYHHRHAHLSAGDRRCPRHGARAMLPAAVSWCRCPQCRRLSDSDQFKRLPWNREVFLADVALYGSRGIRRRDAVRHRVGRRVR